MFETTYSGETAATATGWLQRSSCQPKTSPKRRKKGHILLIKGYEKNCDAFDMGHFSGSRVRLAQDKSFLNLRLGNWWTFHSKQSDEAHGAYRINYRITKEGQKGGNGRFLRMDRIVVVLQPINPFVPRGSEKPTLKTCHNIS